MFANRISSSTSCSISLPEISPPLFPLGGVPLTVFKVATLPAGLLPARAAAHSNSANTLRAVT